MEEGLWESWGWSRGVKEPSGPRTLLELIPQSKQGGGATRMEPDCP